MGQAAASVDRREVILNAAAELFAARGVGATSVREIAEAVGVLSGSLYHHFKSKNNMVEEILGDYFEDLRKTYVALLSEPSAPAADRLKDLIRGSLETISRHPHAAEIYLSDRKFLQTLPHFDYLTKVASEIRKTWLDVIEAGVASGVFRTDIDPRVFYRLVRDGMWPSVRWYRARPGYPVTQLAADVATVYLEGLLVGTSSTGRSKAT